MEAVILSYALDTNGQNHRFVRAAAKYGDDQAVVKALAIGNQDPGGVMGRFQLAAEKLGGLHIRSVHRSAAYFDFPADIVWTRKTEPEIRALVEQADVLHLNNSYMPASRFHARKPMLLHHHGSLFRNDPKHMLTLARQQRMTQAVSTLDLTKPNTDVLHWLPTAYDIDELVAFAKKRDVLKRRIRPDGKVRIVSAPTNRQLKATDALEAAVKHLQAEGLPLELVLVEGQTWKECLTVKATADIVFDQTLYGYGCNAVEAWGLGVPVIAGADEWTLARMRQEWGSLPFYETTEQGIADAIRAMVGSVDLRSEYAALGMAHVRKYHDEKPALARLAELYAMTIARYHGKATSAVEAVRFRSSRAIRLDGMEIIAARSEVAVTDPLVIARLRYFAKRKAMGVEELA